AFRREAPARARLPPPRAGTASTEPSRRAEPARQQSLSRWEHARIPPSPGMRSGVAPHGAASVTSEAPSHLAELNELGAEGAPLSRSPTACRAKVRCFVPHPEW